MPGDELHENAAAGARSGPRHAAPRKPLLTRFHVPAGKAIAIAAMPSAVLMGMGLTPQLAMAKQAPKSPFKDGPCVSAPDPQEQEAQAAKKAAKAEKAEKAKKEAEAAKEAAEKKASGDKEPDATPSGDAGTSPSPSPSASKDKSESPTPSAEPSDSASPSATADEDNPWYDPLGVGKKIEDALDPKKAQERAEEKADDGATASPGASPSGSATAPKSTDGTATKDDAAPHAGKGTDPVKDTVDKLGRTADEAAGSADKLAKEAKDAKEKADQALPSPSAGAPDADGKKPFPCVVEKKSDGSDEQPPGTVPNEPWQLESSALTLRDLDYKGVVNLKTPDGRTKQALKFTAGSVDIGDLHQIVAGPNGKKYHVQAAKGSTSTIRDGQVTMYTERLEGNLFGLIPIVFDPEHPPPINVPFAYFTKVKIAQAGQFGGTLHVPGMHQNITD
ncbi:hypothetical protein [Streptomyces sp. NPDC048644]|uniref:hypothetical protein n=1 Tax=Streptomyces sp. NPDC048644 TaxID=3365582 RepID=UPI0037228A42